MFLYFLFIFLFGISIGSFLNVIIFRLEKEQSFLQGRSYCPQCKHLLKAKDLFPLLSFIWQKGRCRYCQKKISWQYPLVEFFTGLFFCLFFAKNFFFIQAELNQAILFFVRDLILLCFLIIIFVYDFKYLLIPDKIVFFGIIFAILSILFFKEPNFLNSLLASFCLGSFFFFQYFFSKGKWLGQGDIGVGILMGFILGFSKMILAIFLAYLLGAIIGSILLFFQKKTLKSEIAFGPFLVIATIIAMLFGEKIIKLVF